MIFHFKLSCMLMFVVALMIVGTCSHVNAVNNVEWKGTVFVKESLDIPVDSTLSIRDGAMIVFYSSNSTEPEIVISINGTLELGKNVQMISKDFYEGADGPVPSFNTNQWSFRFVGKTKQIVMNSLTVRKTKNMGQSTFDIQQQMDSISVENCLFYGGSSLFSINVVGEHVFKIAHSQFESMTRALSIWNEANACQVMVSNSTFTSIGNTFTHKGSDQKSAKNSFTVEDSSFINVGQGVNSGNVALKLNRVAFKKFKSAVVSISVTARNVDFDNLGTEVSGVAIANSNSDTKNGIFDVQNCKFRNIKGLAIFLNSQLDSLIFNNNEVSKFSPPSDLPLHSLNIIGGKFFLVKSVVLEKNQITNCNANGLYSIINFDSVENLSFTQNSLIGNSAKCSLRLNSAASLNKFTLEHNIFDNDKISGEVCIGDKTNKKFSVVKNYWGKQVDKSLKLPTKEMNRIISSKLSPSSAFEFVPYYLTNNVNDNSDSNLGGYITPEPSGSKPSNDNLAIIIGSSVGGAVLLIVVLIVKFIVIAVAIRICMKKKAAYTEL